MNEDGIVVTDDFAAVIDGATSKSSMLWNGFTTGYMAMQYLCKGITTLPPTCSANEAATHLTACIRQVYLSHTNRIRDVYLHTEKRLTASAVIYSRHRREVWFFGDSQCRVNGVTYCFPKRIDRILADIRSDVLSHLITRGYRLEELLTNDRGRSFILPMLKEQTCFQNNPAAGPYAYPALDGFPIWPSAIPVISVANSCEIILASDGYPTLCNTLKETEMALHHILREDPLCYRIYKSTKGCLQGQASFDDRAFLRIST